MKITIIRHAEPDYENNTLTKKGFREADYLGKYLKDEKLDYIYVSPLNRAKFTADAICRYNATKNYKTCDFLREFNALIDLPYYKNHIIWDLKPSFLNDNLKLYSSDWAEVKEIKNSNVYSVYQEVKQGFTNILALHGYEYNGAYYSVKKPNKDKLVFVCHFGLGSILLSILLNTSPFVLNNHTCMQPSSVTTLVTEEREEGKAIFRMLNFGSIEHLVINCENPSFMARFDEVYSDNKYKLDMD